MKKIIIICLCSLLYSSCNTKVAELKKETISKKNGFVLNGTLENFFSSKVYLNKIIENSIYPIDSSTIENNQFAFKGIVEYPERFALSFDNYSAIVLLVIENTNFQISLNPNQIENPITTGSELNSKLDGYKLASKNIFKKIDYLFPQFQKARLENDVEKLTKIGNEMSKIETEFTDFSYDFIQNNSNSFVSAMILRDQLKSSKIDTIRILNTYKLLSEEVQKSPDAQIIASELNLH